MANLMSATVQQQLSHVDTVVACDPGQWRPLVLNTCGCYVGLRGFWELPPRSLSLFVH
jgi:hypothetical protein